jgi:hypothetical protein
MDDPKNPAENSTFVRDPYTTLCTCKKAPFVMQMPYVHCPSCHATYRSKKLTYPARCGRCQFNLFKWRLRNLIPELDVPFL